MSFEPTRAEMKVLVVEDNAEHLTLLTRLLRGSAHPRFSIFHAESLAQALEQLVGGAFDIVLLDLGLPDSQGLSTFEKASAAAGDTPIVILSGIADVSLAIQTVQKGAQDYLVKGHVDNHLLLRSVQYALERKHAQLALRRVNEQLEERVRARTGELSALNERLQTEVGERKRAEQLALESNQQLVAALEELQGMQRDLIRRERFQALAHMANGIAHEFNNVLTPIVGFAEHVLRDSFMDQAPEHVRRNVEKIKAAALAGSKAVARVRDFARAEAGEFGPVPVADLIESVVSLTEPKWRDEALASGVTVSVAQMVGEVPDVQGDAAQLRELLTHLIFNATGAIDRRGLIQIGAERRGDEVALFVQDTGCGMTESQVRHCEDPNVHAGAVGKRRTGYAVIHDIVARHHGRLEIRSELGKGTTVIVIVPAVQPLDAAIEVEPVIAKPPAKKAGLRVLVADDEPMVQEVIRLYLQEEGHDVEVAGDGGEALEKFHAGTFDLVMTDRAMPEMSGDQLAAKVKAARPHVPVILLTGFGELMNAEGEKPPGVDKVVSKPFTMASLREAVLSVVRR